MAPAWLSVLRQIKARIQAWSEAGIAALLHIPESGSEITILIHHSERLS